MFILSKTKKYLLSSNIKTRSAISLLAFMPLFTLAVSPIAMPKSNAESSSNKVRVFCDGETYETGTDSDTVRQAVEKTQCGLKDGDVAEPDFTEGIKDKSLDIYVYRATPVVVIDGKDVRTAYSGYRDAKDILSSMGIKLYLGDSIKSDVPLPNFTENKPRRVITIERTPEITVVIDGKKKVFRSWGEKVGDVLAEAKVTLGSNDKVIPTIGTYAKDGQKVVIARVEKIRRTVNKTIPFKTIVRKNYNMFQGQSKVIRAGKSGLVQKKYDIITKGGHIVKRVVVSNKMLKHTHNAVVIQGVKPYSHGDLWALMVKAGKRYGVNPADMYSVMMCESGGGVFAQNSGGYKGLFQWDGTFYYWTSVAGVPANYFSPKSQIYATAARVGSSGGWGAWSCKP